MDSAHREFASLLDMADALPHIVWVASPDGSREYFNRHWQSFTGEMNGQGAGDTTPFHPDDDAFAAARWLEARTSGLPYEVDHRVRRGCDGVYRWFRRCCVPRHDQDGSLIGWINICTDIHEQKAAEDTICQLREEMGLLQRRHEEFLSMIAHDLRSPLTAILGWTTLMHEDALDGLEWDDAIAAIARNAEIQARIIEKVSSRGRRVIPMGLWCEPEPAKPQNFSVVRAG